MPFPVTPDARFTEPETDFLIQDPFGLRRAVTPVFAFDTQQGMVTNLRTGTAGLATSFYVTPFGHQLSAMHVITDFFNVQGISVRPGPDKNLIEPCGLWLGVYRDPGLVYGTRPAGGSVVGDELRSVPGGSKQASAGHDLSSRSIEPR
jgi:hypothetical protein